METTILVIALAVTLLYWIIGFSTTWKASLWLIIFSFTSYVVAFQYSNFILRIITNNSVFYRKSEFVNGAFSFIVVFLLIMSLLFFLYKILWNTKSQNKVEQDGLLSFAQSILTAVCGWGIGVVLAIAIYSYFSGPLQNANLEKAGIGSFIQVNANFIIRLGKMVSVNEIPTFLIAWLI